KNISGSMITSRMIVSMIAAPSRSPRPARLLSAKSATTASGLPYGFCSFIVLRPCGCVGCVGMDVGGPYSGPRQGHAGLALVLAATVAVGRLADVIGVGLEEQHLRHALVGVDARRQRRGVAEF